LKARDLAIVAAVLLLGGFALADALRSRGEDAREPTTETTRTDRNGPEPQADAPIDWPSGRLRGTLVFTDADDCRVRVVGLGGGRERPTGDFVGFCDLWAAPVGQRVAYRTAGSTAEGGSGWLTVAELAHPNFAPRTFKGFVGNALWSPDGQRVAWCDENGSGRELQIGSARPRRIARCPLAYDPSGRLVFGVGRRLVDEEGRTLLRQEYRITQAYWGEDESLLVVGPTGNVRRYGPSGDIDSIRFSIQTGRSSQADVVPSPSNCAVLYETAPARIALGDVGCAGLSQRVFTAFDAAWSPDGRWVAVANPDRIEFHEVITGDEPLVWPARARELYWRG
jgi:dipeptidyl aminopeptidase/acylaminoacyl peptidase